MSVDQVHQPAVRPTPPRNPFVGPFPFTRGQRLPNREREAQELADLVVSERVVLLHAPSGAGKTSLIQAAVIPLLSGFHAVGPARVDKPVPTDAAGRPRQVHNRYVRSLAFYLLGGEDGLSPELDGLTLAEVFERALPTPGPGALPLFVLDQLEEVLTLDPTDWTVKEQFFQELGAAIAEGGLWVLLAMREDYMGGLDRCLQFVPGHLRSRYRLDFLTHREALAAIQRPAQSQGVTIDDEAAHLLVEKLAKTKVQTPDRGIEWKPTPYVEPFQLQVVCRRLWKDCRRDSGDFTGISRAQIEKFVDVERALSRYFADSVGDVASGHVEQRAIRDWFESQLITAQGFRMQTMSGPLSGSRDEEVVKRLREMFLINSETRGSTTWYELAHDRLIPAVIGSNQSWRRDKLAPWQNAAFEWQRNNRQKSYLLEPQSLLRVPSSKRRDLTDFERDFLEACQDEAGSRFRVQRYRNASTVLAVIAVLEALVILQLLFV